VDDDVIIACAQAIFKCYQTGQPFTVWKDGRVKAEVFKRSKPLPSLVWLKHDPDDFCI